MKVPVSWLSEYVRFDLPIEELARRLVFSSCEVDRIIRRGVADDDGNLGLFLVGKVVEAGQHPNADRLQLCQVDVGEGEPRQIVCGAWNFGEGASVAVALPGAVLPDGTKLDERPLRGEVSRGMILSERELELGVDHSGIIVLDDAPEPGTPLADVLPLTETVLDIETGFNRPDLTAIYGIAREVAAVADGELAPMSGRDPERAADEPVDVRVEDFEGCPRYVGRTFSGATISPSPVWMRARLTAAGMRPISNVVDVTNYVMLALGSPLHAFDRTLLAEGRIVVRRARPGEKIRTLDGTERELDPTDLVIADAERPVAVAGIMGGENSEVRPETTEILLEAANFDPLTVLRSSRRLRLRTDASTRWEKGVDPYLAKNAAVLATQLIVELAGARWTGHTDVHAELPQPPVVQLRPELPERLVGMPFPVEEQVARLQRLGFEVDGDRVRVPTWRMRDVTRPVDLVEEVARFRLEEVPATLPTREAVAAQLTRSQRLRRLAEEVLVGAGFYEAYTWSLVPLGEGRIPLDEPYSTELAALRTDLELGLVESAERNRNAGVERVALFELARVYTPVGQQLPAEPWHVGAITEGGYLGAKGALETLYRTFHVEPQFRAGGGREATTPEGRVRELDGGWGFFELDLDSLFERVPDLPLYEDVITFPALKQDLAFVVDEGVLAGDLVAAARAAAGPELRDMRPFDVYRGEQVGPRKKSIAFAVAFQSPERTLSDEDAAGLRKRIVQALSERFGAVLRA
ncbi:MAG TPA: phenylalanine--tRNA ligase subunit beta [Gaiellaceae bacterium]|jgi:phenylalanyl-tRNA synthetase beta chain|nr:phenylalanine--tRNA ligase subunit beta [Gaiellaceae bacterium]